MPAAGFRPHGSLTLASDEAELGLLKEAASMPDAAERGFELLDPAAAAEVNPALRGEFAGALLCRRDAIVEPRLVPGAFRDYLTATGGPQRRRLRVATWPGGDRGSPARGSRSHRHLAPRRSRRAVHWRRVHRRRWPAPGRGTSGRRYAASGFRCCETEPFAAQLTTAVADGDSLRYYPAFDLPGRAMLAPQAPVAAAAAAQLLLVQRLDGSLTIGDTHSYDEPFDFDVDEAPYDHLRARAEQLLGAPLPATQAPLGRRLQPGDRAASCTTARKWRRVSSSSPALAAAE